MTTLRSVPDRPSATTSDASSSSTRFRDALRLLRCIDRVAISETMAYNWDAQKCFVVLVSVRDTDARRRAYARGESRRSSFAPPFQIERTPAELQTLLRGIQKWCAKPHAESDATCPFCTPITSGALVAAALRAAHDEKEVYETLEEEEDDDDDGCIASCCFGFLSSPLGTHRTRTLKSGDEWACWLNASIAHARGGVEIKVDADSVCEGARHVPALLTRFLLDGFMRDGVF